jgi:hypothetical protein
VLRLANPSVQSILGAIDYWRFPAKRNTWKGPFNGQESRAILFLSLIVKTNARAIIETGTYRGNTTAFMARAALPTYTVESRPRNYGFARMRLFRHRNVTVRLGDSRQILGEWFRGPLRQFADETVFSYLDAHWETDLPLADEINLIFHHCPRAVVMIDDFEVPFDSGYSYDDYGAGKALTYAYIESAIRLHDLQAFYPSVPASGETGLRRGCVVLAKTEIHFTVLRAMPELHRAHRGVGRPFSRPSQSDRPRSGVGSASFPYAPGE